MASDADDVSWVQVRHFADPAMARMTLDFLIEHGIPAETRGDSPNGVLSPFGIMVDIRLVVPSSRLEEAVEALEAFTSQASDGTPFRGPAKPRELGDDAESGASDEAGAADTLAKKRGVFASVLAFLVPIGGGHFYAGHNVTGIVLALSMALLAVATRDGRVAAGSLLAVVLLDAAFAPRAVRRLNAGRVPSAALQAALGLALVAGAVGLAAAYQYAAVDGPAKAAREAAAAHLAALRARCEAKDADACFDAAFELERQSPEDSAQSGLVRRACELGLERACYRLAR